MAEIGVVLAQIDSGEMALPEFQRGYVWTREQVRSLMQSLYRRYPIGSLLVWATKSEQAPTRGEVSTTSGMVRLLLDGQQRMTSLYGIIKGAPPPFFEGDARAFTGLYFNVGEEVFEFYGTKMKDNPLWVGVNELMREGIGPAFARLQGHPDLETADVVNRLNAVVRIKDMDLHVEEIAGEDKTVEVVVDIFNKVNSGGSKLSKGDLALAKVCSTWPDARGEIRARMDKWHREGYELRKDLVLRCVNALVTGEAQFHALERQPVEAIQKGLVRTERHVDSLLNLIASRLGLDHDRVLGSRYSLPLMVRLLEMHGGSLSGRDRDKLLYWYVHTFLWGHYGSATESTINRDLAQIEDREGAIDRLIDELRNQRGDLQLRPEDFEGWSKGARFYPLLYLMTRVGGAQDWDNGVELREGLLGKHSSLQLHHIFPKSKLYSISAAGSTSYDRSEINALANFTFLTQETNIRISNRDPEDYLAAVAEDQPGALPSHWIPTDPSLWRYERYRDFLAARRSLLAEAANALLNRLLHGDIEDPAIPTAPAASRAPAMQPDPVSTGFPERLRALNERLSDRGLNEGVSGYMLVQNGETVAELDAAWPEGLGPMQPAPVCLLADEDSEIERIAEQAGFTCFADIETLERYAEQTAPAAAAE